MSDEIKIKRPSFQFYPSDWLRDPALRSCSIPARGLWIDMICYMHQGKPYGFLKVNGKVIQPAALSRMCGLSLDECTTLLTELFDAGVYLKDDSGAIYSPRMVRDEDIRNKRAEGGGKGGNPALMKVKPQPEITTKKSNLKTEQVSTKKVNDKDNLRVKQNTEEEEVVKEEVKENEIVGDNKPESKTEKTKSKSDSKTLNFEPFNSPEFAEAWNNLITLNKHWKKKIPAALQITLDKLKKYDERFATQLVSTAFDGEYQGIIFPDTNEKYEAWLKTNKKVDNKKTTHTSDEYKSDFRGNAADNNTDRKQAAATSE